MELARSGFEPMQEDPIGFLVKRLNRSAIAAVLYLELFCGDKHFIN